ncbi:MAG: SDR family oxidoreductase [Rhodospirillaceae bacterium]|nr:SDR family oxidoreductase [Rhodospirillaceae bacterium]
MTMSLRIAALSAAIAVLNPLTLLAKESVFVAGATGRTGSGIVKALAADSFEVIALARDLSKIKEETPGVRWVQGDVRDFPSIVRGMAGADFVVSAIGSTTGTGPNAAEFVDFAGTRNLVDAAKQSGARQFVLIASGRTGPHLDHSTHRNFGYTRYFKTKGEEYLKVSGLPYTILGAAGLVEKPAGQMGVRFFSRVEYDATTKSTDEMVIIAIPDIAAVVSAALKDPAARNKAFAIMNDAKLPVGGWRDNFKATDPTWP